MTNNSWKRRTAALGVVLALFFCARAEAQTPVPLGTFSAGEVWAPLFGPFTWTLAPGSTLPAGLAIRTETPPFLPPEAQAGIIGIATVPGTYTFTLLRSGVAVDYRIKITPLTVKDNFQVIDAFVNKSYSYQLTALNAAGSTTWTIDGSTLPPGVTLSPAGVLSGTPTQSGSYNVSFNVTDGVDTVFRSVQLSIFDIEITTNGTLPNATQGVPYTATIAASGGAGGYTFTAGNLPPGLALSQSGTISGTTFVGASHWQINVTATDTNHVSNTKVMAIVVSRQPLALPMVLPGGSSETTNFFDDCSFGVPCVVGPFVSGGGRAPFHWLASGLAPGMDVRSGSGNTMRWVGPNNLEIWGVPTAIGTFPVRLTVVDADGRSATNTFNLRVVPIRAWNFLENGAVGAAYSHSFLVVGGRPGYTAALTGGRLPAGLALDPATLTVAGTPLESGNFDAVFEFHDADGVAVRVTNYFSIGRGASTLEITREDHGFITAGETLDEQLFACCAPAKVWSIASGTPPPGLSLSPDGVVTGTVPLGTSGTFVFVLRVEDPGNPVNFALRQFTVIVTPLSVSDVNLPFGNVGTPYHGFVAASGGAGITWAVEPFQYLPPGVTVHPDGTIDGTPTESGQYTFILRATDAGGHFLSNSFDISVFPAGVAPPLDLPFGPEIQVPVGPVTMQLEATGGTPPYSYSYSPGAPVIPGVRVQSGGPMPTFFTPGTNGALLGVVTTPGVYSTSIRVTDSGGQFFDRAITLTATLLQILSVPSLPRPTVGVPYEFTLTPFGGSVYSWEAFGLPSGLTIDATGRISGTPATAGAFNLSITVTDTPTLTSTTTFHLLIVNPFEITTGGVLPPATVGTFYSQAFASSGCVGACTASFGGGQIPAGLSLVNGVLSGTPTAVSNASFNVLVSGTNGTVQKVFFLRVVASTPQPLTIQTSSTGDTTVGLSREIALFARGGTPPYQWSLAPGSNQLPLGMSIQGPGETLGGILTPGVMYLAGRPLQAAQFTFTLRVTDDTGATSDRTFNWNVTALFGSYVSLPLPGNPLLYNVPYAQPLLFMGGTGSYTFTPSSLPPGLTVGGSSGVISGTPSDTGTFNSNVLVSDTGGNSLNQFLSFNVSSGTAVTLGFVTGQNLGTVLAGFTMSSNIIPSGGTAPYTITAVTPLPAPFALTPIAGGGVPAGSVAITGVPPTAGSFSFTLRAQDAAGNIGARTFTVTVNLPPLPTATLTASPDSIEFGATSTLSWTTANATSVSINQGIGTVALSGTRSVGPLVTRTYALTATNAAGPVTATVTVTVGPPPFVITNPAAGDLTPVSAAITWTTSVAANSRVEYGTTTAYGASVFDAALVTAHSVALAGLTPSTAYHYRITSQAAAGAPVTTVDFVFTTPARPRTVGDFDGDGKADMAIFRPSTGAWYVLQSSTGTGAFAQWGVAGDTPVAGDYDGDGKSDVAIYRPSAGIWYIVHSSTKAIVARQWGISGDVPTAGDYDGDGKTDVAVYRPSTGTWFIVRSSTGSVASSQWGISGDVPTAGDYDGDGKTDVAIFRPSTGAWYIVRSSTGGVSVVQWGIPGDVPLSADYDGDGKADAAVFRASTGQWFIKYSGSAGFGAVQWGVPGDVPVPMDCDGDGKTDVAVYRPATGTWYVVRSGAGGVGVFQWGISGDTPILKR